MGKAPVAISVNYTGEFRALERAIDGAVRGGEWKEVGSKTNPKHFFSGPGVSVGYNPESTVVTLNGPKNKVLYTTLVKQEILPKKGKKSKKSKRKDSKGSSTSPNEAPSSPMRRSSGSGRTRAPPSSLGWICAIVVVLGGMGVAAYFATDGEEDITLPLLALAGGAVLLLLVVSCWAAQRRTYRRTARHSLVPMDKGSSPVSATVSRGRSRRHSVIAHGGIGGSRDSSGSTGSSLRHRASSVAIPEQRSRSASKSVKKRVVLGGGDAESRSRSGSKTRKMRDSATTAAMTVASATGEGAAAGRGGGARGSSYRRELVADLAEETGVSDLDITSSGRLVRDPSGTHKAAIPSERVVNISFVDTVRGELNADEYSHE